DPAWLAAELLASTQRSRRPFALATGYWADQGDRSRFGPDRTARCQPDSRLERRPELAQVRVGRAPAMGIPHDTQASEADTARVGHSALRRAGLLRLGGDRYEHRRRISRGAGSPPVRPDEVRRRRQAP